MKDKTKVVITFVFSVTITILILGAYRVYTRLPFELFSPSLMILTRPGKPGFHEHIYLYRNGFQDRSTSLCVPLSKRYDYFKIIGSWEGVAWEAIWSKDGSVLGMKLNDYFLAYDFNNGQSIPSQKNKMVSTSSPDPDVTQKIRNLINERGGPGLAIPYSQYAFVELRYQRWKEFEAVLKAGERTD